jgi:hypothetical protein
LIDGRSAALAWRREISERKWAIGCTPKAGES